MPQINVVTDFFGISGYSVHGRNLVRALKKLNPETYLETTLPQDWHKAVDNLGAELCSKGNKPEAWQVMITNPLMAQYKIVEPNKGVLPFFVFEGDKAPKQWEELARKFRKILVPSEHTKQALLNANVEKERIEIIPHGHDPSVFNPQVQTIPQFESDKFTFVWNKGWSKGEKDRSGFHHVLKAFCAEFKPDEPVRLLVHINPTYNRPDWNIGNECQKIMLPPKEERAEISISMDAWNDLTVAQFYKAGDVYVGITCADAFNLPVLEAMACGLPVIISDFGGQTDFAVGDYVWKVSGELKPAPVFDLQEKPLYEQTNWLVPDQQQIRNALRASFEMWKNNKEEFNALGVLASEASKSWTWEISAKRLLSVIEELEGNKK